MKKLVLSIGVVVATTFAVFSQRPSNAISYVEILMGRIDLLKI